MNKITLKNLIKEEVRNALTESGFARMMNIMRGLVPNVDTFAILSAENPFGKQASSSYNSESRKRLEKRLRGMNFGFQKLKGKYGQLENSLFIPNIMKSEAMELGKEFDQESIIFGEKAGKKGDYEGMKIEMVYTDDRFGEVEGTRYVWVNMSDADDLYSVVKGRKFQIPFFDEEYEDVQFKPNSGAINKEGIDAELIQKINDGMSRITEEHTKKSRWINRGYVNRLLREAYNKK